MIALEFVLIVSLIPGLLRPFFPARKLPRWVDFLPAAALGLCLVDFLLERYAFRMYPAYLLALLTCLFSLRRMLRPAASVQKRRFLPIFGAVLGVLLLIPAATLPFLLPMRTLLPTGSYAVGTASYDWIDTSRPETYSDQPGAKRRLVVQFWYPTDQKPASWKALDTPGALLSSVEAKYPVVIFSHGATGVRTSNASTYRDLASHGYIVASIDHTYLNFFTRFSDGSPVLISQRYLSAMNASGDDPAAEAEILKAYEIRVEDMKFVLDQVEQLNREGTMELPSGRLDVGRVGLFGHSLGGSTAGTLCRSDRRCKAVIIMDGTMRGEITGQSADGKDTYTSEPFPAPMLMIEDSGLYDNPAYADGYAPNRSAYEHANQPAYNLVFNGTEHLNLTDVELLVAPAILKPLGNPQAALGSIDPIQCGKALNAYNLAFFDQYLKGQPSPLLNGPSAQYNFVRFESNVK